MIACRQDNGKLTIEHLHNPGNHAAPVALNKDNLQIGLSNINIKFENGYLECSLTRLKKIQNEVNYFDIKDNKYYILNAHGPVVRG